MKSWHCRPGGLLLFQTQTASLGLNRWLIISFVFLSIFFPELQHKLEIVVSCLTHYSSFVYENITIKSLFSHIGNCWPMSTIKKENMKRENVI